MKVVQAENSRGSKFSQSGVTVTFETNKFLSLGSYVKIWGHNFSVIRSVTGPTEDISGAEKTARLIITATETGYHGYKFNDSFDPRLLLGKEIVPVTNDAEIEEIRKESGYC